MGSRSRRLLAFLSVCYVLLAGSTVALPTVQWDELTDLVIAADLADRPLRGSIRDPSQARLPMYVMAVPYRIMRWADPDVNVLDTLIVSRWISIFMTVLGIWVTAYLGFRLFDPATAMLGAGLFALSPYVLHFGRDALTQGDAFTPALVMCALLAFDRFEHQRSTRSLFIFSLFLGLAVASKFTLVVIIPALMLYQLLSVVVQRYRRASGESASEPRIVKRSATPWPFVWVALATGSCAILAVVCSMAAVDGWARSPLLLRIGARAAWLSALLGLVVASVLAMRPVRKWLAAIGCEGRWPLGAAWLAILPLGAAATLALFPEHIFNRDILLTLIDRAATRDGGQEFGSTAVASAKLYSGLLLFKLGLPFGIATLFAFAWMLVKAVESRALLLLTATLACYGLMLLALPLQQPFWLVSVYPLIVLALSAATVHHLRSKGSRLSRFTAAGTVAIASVWLAVGLVRVYPTFGYYGYETIGDRWWGTNSRGYRAVVVVTNDGSAEAMEWLRRNAEAGSVVLAYLDDIFVLNYLQKLQPFDFELRHALQYGDPRLRQTELGNADYVVVRAIDDLGIPSPLSDARFTERFRAEPVHAIVRGRGVYRMPVIQIYKRRPKPSA